MSGICNDRLPVDRLKKKNEFVQQAKVSVSVGVPVLTGRNLEM